ncbi:small ribosomal subunit protein bS6m [Anabrus simplex]|uniref:small ribosomal subunit protein bS6m n=1 Tax=Anabrus simplex TaxID=316456 RepID=UPI0034DD64D4
MPTYEMPLLLRIMSRSEVVSTLRRTADAIFEKGGIIRQINNLGTRELPFKMSAHGMVHKKGSYFMFQFDVPPSSLGDLAERYGRDVDIIKRRIYKVEEEPEFECTLEEEMRPPAYRKEVQEMMAIGEKKHRPRFKYNSGLDYYPFQK